MPVVLPGPVQRDAQHRRTVRPDAVPRPARSWPASPGATAPQPFGGSLRTIVVNLDPERLRAYNLSPEKVADALNKGNTITPSGNARIKDQMPIVSVNSIVVNPQDLGNIPIKPEKSVYLRDLGTVEDTTDIPTGWALVNGRRAVYMPILKTADASTLTVVNELKDNLDACARSCPRTSS